ncbi:unnamed protein product [Adineta steineri]|uniref:G-protein coupled receptors family 1 profile domain-containing protein n=1 Tax=Adineta steineri TaxID=433720 RepID=A0A814FVI0_9BILA|nr:unnamed protein product [Adineta steineri]CAF0990005.1 unnamed protein product [Adineta steineri]
MSSSSVSDEILKFATQYSLYTGCIMFSFGVIGNVLNLLVFTQLKLFRTNRCAFYITVESISNFIYQLLSITLTILTAIYGDDATGRFLIWCKLSGFLPVVIASLFSILAYHNVRHIVRRQLPIVRRKLDKQITAMVLMRVIAFVCLSSPYNAYRIYSINFPTSRSMPMAYAIIRLIQAILLSIFITNYTINFYIFILFSSRFRRQVKLVLVKKCWERWKYWCCRINNQIEPVNSETRNSQMESEENV